MIRGLTETPDERLYAVYDDPIDQAAALCGQEVEVFAEIAAARRLDPRSYPVWTWELSPMASGRRIVGRLLDAGWTLPEDAR